MTDKQKLYLPATVALWLLLESGTPEDDPDAVYLRDLGDEMILIEGTDDATVTR